MFSLLIQARDMFAVGKFDHSTGNVKLNQTPGWGTGVGSSFGEGTGFDGDGVGMNVPDEDNSPYN
eukprot:CAMPEP_0181347480 /NCGR_PEP_ID=MMETSP1101-20121128/33902_1 /TAXON_ID=46948 /ORGANISM="Rhodomonas abbreviata, Strain Caron Lab Isolate" /LENGTH=64 /DNA_ID=CAMNT_0023459699 /DNA_START=390 /DNA_END=584 /DNA_ORIENTATION=-